MKLLAGWHKSAWGRVLVGWHLLAGVPFEEGSRLMMEDGTSLLLLEDGTSAILLDGTE